MLPLYLFPSRVCNLRCLYRIPLNNLCFQTTFWRVISKVIPSRRWWHILTLRLPLDNITNQKHWFQFWQCHHLRICHVSAHLILYIILNPLINILLFLHSWLLAEQFHLFLLLGICLALDLPLLNFIIILQIQIRFRPVSRPPLPLRCTIRSVLLFWLGGRTWANECLLHTAATPLKSTPSALSTSRLWT